jgi:hypothetical protein
MLSIDHDLRMEPMEHSIIDSPRPSAPDAAHDPFDDGRALQDRLRVHCFGSGTLNARGLHIKSRWEGDAFVCVWQPRPESLVLRARIVEHGERKSVVACSVRQGPVECAAAEAITVRVKGLG